MPNTPETTTTAYLPPAEQPATSSKVSTVSINLLGGYEATPFTRERAIPYGESTPEASGRIFTERSDMPSLTALLVFLALVQDFPQPHRQPVIRVANTERALWMVLAVGAMFIGGVTVISFTSGSFWLQPAGGLMIAGGWIVLVVTLWVWGRGTDRSPP